MEDDKLLGERMFDAIENESRLMENKCQTTNEQGEEQTKNK